jgi:hypothetical protein
MAESDSLSGEVGTLTEYRNRLRALERDRDRLASEVEARVAREKELCRRVARLTAQVEDLALALGRRDRELGILAGRLDAEYEACARSRGRLEAVTAELRALTSSRMWSLVELVWRARMRIVPPGSQRERFLGLHQKNSPGGLSS